MVERAAVTGTTALETLGQTGYLGRLLDRAGRLQRDLAAVPSDRRSALVPAARRDAARASVRLDASPLSAATAEAVEQGRAGRGRPEVAAGTPAGGWAAALHLDTLATQDLAALEYRNALAAYDAEACLARRLTSDPQATVAALHGLLCDGLVDPARSGRPRPFDLDVHEGAQGQVLYRTPAAPAVPALLEELWAWLAGPAGSAPALLAAGVVHLRILAWQPYPAANGRLARSLARVVLRAFGADPDGLCVPEPLWLRDPLGYHRDVAATLRRRGDLTGWLANVVEACVLALEDAAVRCGGQPVPQRLPAVVAALEPDAALTVPAYAAAQRCDHVQAEADLAALRAAGHLRLEPGTRGLRYRRRR